MKFFILAAGYGRRAEPLSLVKPKPAFPLDGEPLISLLLRQLRDRGCAEGFVNLHHLGEQVAAAAGGGVRFLEEKELSGSRVLRRALPFLSDWLLAVNGDTFMEIPLEELAAPAREPDVDGVLAARADRSGRYARLRCAGGDFLESGPPPPAGEEGLMYAGAALFSRRALERIDDDNFFRSIERHRLRFRVVVYEDIWLDVGTPASYYQANWDFKARYARPGGNALSPGAVIHPEAVVERSVLWEGSRVGPGVRLSGCIVTGGVALRRGTHERCILGRGGSRHPF